MSLFKILQGSSSRISLDVTPFHNGWCYFTSDDGGFYIDSEDNGVQKRTRINPPQEPAEDTSPLVINAVLPADGWTNGQQVLDVPELRENQDGMIGVPANLTEEQLNAVYAAQLYVSSQDAGSLTIKASGDVPACDIPVALILLRGAGSAVTMEQVNDAIQTAISGIAGTDLSENTATDAEVDEMLNEVFAS